MLTTLKLKDLLSTEILTLEKIQDFIDLVNIPSLQLKGSILHTHHGMLSVQECQFSIAREDRNPGVGVLTIRAPRLGLHLGQYSFLIRDNMLNPLDGFTTLATDDELDQELL